MQDMMMAEMPKEKNSMKQRLIGMFMAMMLVFGFGFATMEQTHASGLGSMDVKIQDNGQMTISGNSGITTGKKSGQAWTDIIAKYRNFIVGISGIGAVAMVMFFIFNLLKLGATSGNPSERSKALSGLVWSGIAAAGLGSVTVIVGFFYSALQ